MQCDDVSDLPAWAFGEPEEIDEITREHLETCLRCQAEVVQYRRLSRGMRSLRHFEVVPAADLDEQIFSVLDHPELLPSVHRPSRRTAYLSGLAAATAAGAAGALVIASRARSRRLAG